MQRRPFYAQPISYAWQQAEPGTLNSDKSSTVASRATQAQRPHGGGLCAPLPDRQGNQPMKVLRVAMALSIALMMGAIGTPVDAHGAEAGDNRHETAARSAVDTALAELRGVLDDAGLSSQQRLTSIEKIVSERFDMEVAGQLALNKGKGRLSSLQAVRYQCEFEAYFSNYIGSRLERYRDAKLEILSATQKKSDVIVNTRIVGGKYDRKPVGFWMRKANDRWRAIDLIFDQSSVIKSIRSQVFDGLSSGGPEAMIQTFKELNGSRSNC